MVNLLLGNKEKKAVGGVLVVMSCCKKPWMGVLVGMIVVGGNREGCCSKGAGTVVSAVCVKRVVW